MLALIAKDLGVFINTTPSASPVGIYREEPHFRKLAKGELVSVCLPHRWAVFAQERGFIGGGGQCADQSMPLIKQIGGVAGDKVYVAPGSVRHVDSRGRPMPHLMFGQVVVPEGMIWLQGDDPRSFDSRYYGVVPAENVLTVLQPVVTW